MKNLLNFYCGTCRHNLHVKSRSRPHPFRLQGRILSSARYLSYSTRVDDASDQIKNNGKDNSPFYDIVIAGGGLVGTTLAVALGKTGKLANKKILLLESAKSSVVKAPSEDVANFSNRVVALNPSSKSLLEKLGIWRSVWRFQEVYTLQVWDALSNASITLNNPNYSTPVSYIVENPVLGYAISEALKETSNVTVEFGSMLKSCIIPTQLKPLEKTTVLLKDDRTFSTTLLVGADGYNSLVRSAIDSPYINFNYDRIALVATLKLSEQTENNVAWQRFLPTGGPIALLPLSSDHSSLVWSTTPSKAHELYELSPDAFVEAVNSALWQDYPKSELVKRACDMLSSVNLGGKPPRIFPPSAGQLVEGSRASFPLGFGHAAYYVHRRTAIIGDAAHRVHPLAGLGLNLGLGDVSTLQNVIDKAIGYGRDFGSLEVLREYETERQRHNFAIQSGIDFLHRLYSFEFSPIVALRTVGLSLVNSSDLLKKYIITQAAA